MIPVTRRGKRQYKEQHPIKTTQHKQLQHVANIIEIEYMKIFVPICDGQFRKLKLRAVKNLNFVLPRHNKLKFGFCKHMLLTITFSL